MEQPPAINTELKYIGKVLKEFRSQSLVMSTCSAGVPKTGPEEFHFPFMAWLQNLTVSREFGAVIKMGRGRTSFYILYICILTSGYWHWSRHGELAWGCLGLHVMGSLLPHMLQMSDESLLKEWMDEKLVLGRCRAYLLNPCLPTANKVTSSAILGDVSEPQCNPQCTL